MKLYKIRVFSETGSKFRDRTVKATTLMRMRVVARRHTKKIEFGKKS